MASENATGNETFDEVLRCLQNDIVHFVGKPVKHTRDLLEEYHDRFKTAHKSEVAELEAKLSNAETARRFFARRLDGAKEKVAELRECLKEALGCFCSHDASMPCAKCWVYKVCQKKRWRKALEGASND